MSSHKRKMSTTTARKRRKMSFEMLAESERQSEVLKANKSNSFEEQIPNAQSRKETTIVSNPPSPTDLFDVSDITVHSDTIDLFDSDIFETSVKHKSADVSKNETKQLKEGMKFNDIVPSNQQQQQQQQEKQQEQQNDSTFGDMDLSLLERQCLLEMKEKENKNHIKTPVKTKTPIAQSTPQVKAGNVSGLARRMKDRLLENAHRTPTSKASNILRTKPPHPPTQQLLTQDIGPYYGLPSKVKTLLGTLRGIKTVYDWQHKCLTLDGVKEGRNLIYSLPTSGGKTLVAEILIFRELLCKKKDAVFVLPFVAIVQEKIQSLAQFAVELGFLVEEYAAGKGRFPPRKRRKRNVLYVCTIEKANTLVNSLVEASRLSELGLIVVDELHMIGEGGRRGSTIETMLTKVLHVSGSTQIIGMSATLSNLPDLQKFLNADVFTDNFRPVALDEFVKVADSVFKVDSATLCPEERLEFHRMIGHQTKEIAKGDTDHIVSLVLEVIPQHSCLIFCPTKKNCENVAKMICKLLPRNFLEQKVKQKISMLEGLCNEGEICQVLRGAIPYGVAYHHSGLTTDERRIIEDGYRNGVLSVITCTSTLAAGVNLPARRVIIRSPHIGRSFMSRSQYKQMIGRAGRAGIDTKGESFLIVSKPQDQVKVVDLIGGPVETCISSLMYDSGKGFRTLLLNLIGLKVCYMISFNEYGSFQVTKLGNATFKSSIDYDISNQLYDDLKNGLQGLVLENYLHLLYLVTPYDTMVSPDWMVYLNEINRLEPGELAAATVIGIEECYITMRASGRNPRKKKANQPKIDRFYVTLMLNLLFKGKSVWEVSTRFDQPRGFLQNLLSNAAAFASHILLFTKELDELWAYQSLIEKLIQVLQYCTVAELVPLMEIPGVRMTRAKQLLSSGFKTLAHIATAQPGALCQSIDHLSRKQAAQLIASAKILLEEKVESLQEEVEDLKAVTT
ncbi:helicase POLQ-like [Ciona intestinalis]